MNISDDSSGAAAHTSIAQGIHQALRARTGVFVAVTVVIVAVLMFIGPFEKFSEGDLKQIRTAVQRLHATCEGQDTEAVGLGALSMLRMYFDRDPEQPLPLYGATSAVSMSAVLTGFVPVLKGGGCAAMPALGDELAEILGNS